MGCLRVDRGVFLRLYGAVVLVFIVWTLPVQSWAKPTSQQQVERVVRHWLALDHRPFETTLGLNIKEIVTFSDVDGQPAYHIANLEQGGFIIVSGDNLVEPIIGFVPSGEYDPSSENPMAALVSHDMPVRVQRAREVEQQLGTSGMSGLAEPYRQAVRKWSVLESDFSVQVTEAGIDAVSDIWVMPFLVTRWGQSEEEGGMACFNRFTPNNDPCGCVATAFAQVLRFFEYPTAGVGTPSFTISVDDVAEDRELLGGDGNGGPYHWSLMPSGPAVDTSTSRAAIGRLTYDAGLSVNMEYSIRESGTDTRLVADALKDTFGYSNAVKGTNSYENLTAVDRNNIINPNLDAGYPVILAIKNNIGGHAIVSDGYGYNSDTLYHHLNMGWRGLDDAWYNLPDIDAGTGYAIIYKAVYNIFITGSGEIISGRVTDAAGNPIENAAVTAVGSGGESFNAVTNANGIYALAKIPSDTFYELNVVKTGYTFSSRVEFTRVSIDDTTVGNRWRNDFVGAVYREQPDLIVLSPYVGESLVAPSQKFILSATVRNNGTATADATVLHYYLSANDVISTYDTELATDDVVSLLAGKLGPEQATVSIDTEGTWWIGACVEAVADESNRSNQCSTAVEITVSADPDLVAYASVNSALLTPGQSFNIYGTVQNQGSATADSTILRYYLFNKSGPVELATDAISSLVSGGLARGTATVPAPPANGVYWVSVCVDVVPGESDTTNQCSPGVKITVSSTPDLISSALLSVSFVTPGTPVSIMATVRNDGTAGADSTTLRYYLSGNWTISTADTELGTDVVSALGPGGLVRTRTTIPAPSVEGEYWVGVCVDAVSGESPVTNQCSPGIPLLFTPGGNFPWSLFLPCIIGGNPGR